MQRFKNILLVIQSHTPELAALSRALSLARNNGASLTVIDIVKAIPDDFPTSTVRLTTDKLQQLLIHSRREELERALESATTEADRPPVCVLAGTPFLEIIRAVLHNHYDLVMKAAELPGGRREQLFGSTDMHLMRKCPCPVWIIKPAQRKRFARVLASVDLEPLDESGTLNSDILRLALSVAQSEHSELHIVHAWNLFGEHMLRGWRADTDINRALRQTRAFYKQQLDRLLDQFDFQDVTLRTHLLKGIPEKVLPALATREQVELIVMGTVARTGIPGLLIGNTAEKVLAEVDCSVLTVKPAGFRTPVRPAG